jgi:hypothetical protein
MLSLEEQEKIVRALKGPQSVRVKPGSLYIRGAIDSYYGNRPNPHYAILDSYDTIKTQTFVHVTDEASVAEYMAGYENMDPSYPDLIIESLGFPDR